MRQTAQVLYLTCLLANAVVISSTNKLSKQMRFITIKKPGTKHLSMKNVLQGSLIGIRGGFYTFKFVL
jgi:hypothetical protein